MGKLTALKVERLETLGMHADGDGLIFVLIHQGNDGSSDTRLQQTVSEKKCRLETTTKELIISLRLEKQLPTAGS